MKSIVITGSTSGIGLGLADSFLALGCSVTISGHSKENLNKAHSFLATKYEQSRLSAHICDVTDFDQVQALWDEAKAHFGNVDIWINNAGVGHSEIGVQDYSPDLVNKVVNTNVIGAIYGSVLALRGMLEQGACPSPPVPDQTRGDRGHYRVYRDLL